MSDQIDLISLDPHAHHYVDFLQHLAARHLALLQVLREREVLSSEDMSHYEYLASMYHKCMRNERNKKEASGSSGCS